MTHTPSSTHNIPLQNILVFNAMQGLTVAMLILVNIPGSWDYRYPLLAHADWNGCTPTDLILPFFLFSMGGMMFFGFKAHEFKWSSHLAEAIARRTLIIFFLGLLFNAVLNHQDFFNLRIMGVLQRIALTYIASAIVLLSLRQDYLLGLCTVILVAYWLLLYLAGGAEPFSISSNAVIRSDIFLFGNTHIWHGKGVPFDSEGLLSCLPSIVNVLIGFELARTVSTQRQRWRTIGLLTVAGLNLVILAMIWSLWLPINKSLWTSSYVIYSAGYFLLALALMIWLVDIKDWATITKPLLVLNSNSLFIFLVAVFWVNTYNYIPVKDAGDLYHASFLWLSQFMPPSSASLTFAVIHVILFWRISYFLFRRNIFIPFLR